jgi:Short C-terminal domain
MMRRRGPGLVRTVARTAVVAGTASAVAGRVHHRQEEKWQAEATDQQAGDAAALQEQLAAQQAQEAQSVLSGPAPAPDLTTQLEQLAQLRQSGILTDEEFAAAKAKLLG